MSVQHHVWTQPFFWGGLLLFDDGGDWFPPDGGEGLRADETCVSVSVIHAQDYDLERTPDDDPEPWSTVRVRVVVGAGPPENATIDFDGPLGCPSGRLTVGDAENERILDVPAGRRRVRIALRPEEHAERVNVWIT